MSEILVIEKNMCIISLREYNKLRDFKTNIEKNMVYIGQPFSSTLVITADEAVQKMALIAKESREREITIRSELYSLQEKFDALERQHGIKPPSRFFRFIKKNKEE